MNAANILVVDDEPQIRRVLRSTLSERGYVITEAKTGEEALEWMRKEPPDLILLDVNMPGIGGIEACREIRRGSDATPTRASRPLSHLSPSCLLPPLFQPRLPAVFWRW